MRLKIKFVAFNFLCALALFSSTVFAQSKPQKANPAPTPPMAANAGKVDFDAIREEAMDLSNKGQLIKALPLLEKAAPKFPNDAELQANYGMAVLVDGLTSKDPSVREKAKQKSFVILKKAKELGTRNQLALHYFDGLQNPNSNLDLIGGSANKEVEDLIREGEAFFGSGEYDKALVLYEKAYKLDPKNYEAALFAGDCFYSQRKYAESEAWFAKAVAINPNREQAHRFWGDALMGEGKSKEGLAKFADAIIAEPDSRLAWNQLFEWTKNRGNRQTTPIISAPGSEENDSSEIKINSALLKSEDGTINWQKYLEIQKLKSAKLSVVADIHPEIISDVEALKAVIEGIKSDTKAGKIKTLNAGLVNLLKLEATDTVDVYVLMFLHGASECPEFEAFREQNRDKMRRFFIEYIAEVKL